MIRTTMSPITARILQRQRKNIMVLFSKTLKTGQKKKDNMTQP